MTMDELANVKGRGWEDIDVSLLPSAPGFILFAPSYPIAVCPARGACR
jgi:hypothetical protein